VRRASLPAVLCGFLLAGCGLIPAVRSDGAPTGAGPVSVQHNEVPTPPGAQEHGVEFAAPAVAVRAFVARYINWDGADVRSRLRMLEHASVGQARSAMALEAAQTGADPELVQAGVINSGTVEAVAPLRGGAGRFVAVTRESTTATRSAAYDGLAPAWHVAIVTVTRRGHGWVVSGFAPES
jgi:hypothetical protein